VARFSPAVTKDELEGIFSKYGTVNEILMKNGYAFVQFSDVKDAQTAARALDGYRIGNDELLVETANEAFRGRDTRPRPRYDDRRYERRYSRSRSGSRSRSPYSKNRRYDRSGSRSNSPRRYPPRRYDDNRSHRRYEDEGRYDNGRMGNRGHSYGDRGRYENDRDRPRNDERTCFRCGGYGHFARYCPTPSRPMGSGNRYPSNNNMNKTSTQHSDAVGTKNQTSSYEEMIFKPEEVWQGSTAQPDPSSGFNISNADEPSINQDDNNIVPDQQSRLKTDSFESQPRHSPSPVADFYT
jgi:RNA recognition motif-containing protein